MARPPHKHGIEKSFLCIRQEPLKLRAAFLRSGPPQINILANDLGASLACEFAQMDELALEVEEGFRLQGKDVLSSEEVGLAVLDRLRALDEVAYLRFASVYKGFSAAGDFEREAGLLKSTEPKRGVGAKPS